MSVDIGTALVEAQLLEDDPAAPVANPAVALVVCLWAPFSAVLVRDCDDPLEDFSEKGQLDFFDLTLPVLVIAGAVSDDRTFFDPLVPLLRCCLCPLPGIQEMRDRCCWSGDVRVATGDVASPVGLLAQQLPVRAFDERDRRPVNDKEPNRVDAAEDVDFRLQQDVTVGEPLGAVADPAAAVFDRTADDGDTTLPAVTVVAGVLSLVVFAKPVESALVDVVAAATTAAVVSFEELSSNATVRTASFPVFGAVVPAADEVATEDDPASVLSGSVEI